MFVAKPKARQSRCQPWSRADRRRNREFLQARMRNGERTPVDEIIRVVYFNSRRHARCWLI